MSCARWLRCAHSVAHMACARADRSGNVVLVGYARASKIDQNLALQRDALTGAGCEELFAEHMSGAVADRLQLAEALK